MPDWGPAPQPTATVRELSQQAPARSSPPSHQASQSTEPRQQDLPSPPLIQNWGYVKQMLGYNETRYRGLAKNEIRLALLRRFLDHGYPETQVPP